MTASTKTKRAEYRMVRVRPEYGTAIDTLAAKKDMTIAAIVHRALANYFMANGMNPPAPKTKRKA